MRGGIGMLCRALLALSGVGWLVPAAATGDFRVVTEQWTPFNYLEAGQPAGMAVELLQAAMRRADLRGGIEFLPWERAYKIALQDPGVMIFTMARKPERESLFIWVAPIYPRTIYLYKSRQRDDVRLDSLQDALRYQVVAAGESDASALDLKNLGFERGRNLHYTYGTDAQRAKMLISGRADLLPMHELQVRPIAREAGVDPGQFVRLLPLSNREDDYYFAFSIGTPPALVDAMRNAFHALRDDGTWDAILRKYRP